MKNQVVRLVVLVPSVLILAACSGMNLGGSSGGAVTSTPAAAQAQQLSNVSSQLSNSSQSLVTTAGVGQVTAQAIRGQQRLQANSVTAAAQNLQQQDSSGALSSVLVTTGGVSYSTDSQIVLTNFVVVSGIFSGVQDASGNTFTCYLLAIPRATVNGEVQCLSKYDLGQGEARQYDNTVNYKALYKDTLSDDIYFVITGLGSDLDNKSTYETALMKWDGSTTTVVYSQGVASLSQGFTQILAGDFNDYVDSDWENPGPYTIHQGCLTDITGGLTTVCGTMDGNMVANTNITSSWFQLGFTITDGLHCAFIGDSTLTITNVGAINQTTPPTQAYVPNPSMGSMSFTSNGQDPFTFGFFTNTSTNVNVLMDVQDDYFIQNTASTYSDSSANSHSLSGVTWAGLTKFSSVTTTINASSVTMDVAAVYSSTAIYPVAAYGSASIYAPTSVGFTIASTTAAVDTSNGNRLLHITGTGGQSVYYMILQTTDSHSNLYLEFQLVSPANPTDVKQIVNL